MAPNEHLLKNFKVCQETYALALQLLRDANAKSIPGAGTPGAPAVCMIIAVERLNTGEYTKKSAQPPSSLSPKEFNKLYERIKGAAEKITTTPSSTTYQQLHDKYKTGLATTGVQELLSETENELLALETGCDPMSHLFKCVVFFWVINAAKPKSLPGTQGFAAEHQLSAKKFTVLLGLLNESCASLRESIQRAHKERPASPSKKLGDPSTPKRSPRKAVLRDPPSKDTPKKPLQEATMEEPDDSPSRMSSRTAVPQESPSKATRTSSRVRTQTPKASPVRLFPVKGPLRELPTRDSPKKRQAEISQSTFTSDDMDVDTPLPETPTKKRRIDSPTKPALRSTTLKVPFPSTPSSSRVTFDDTPTTPSKPTALSARPSSPLKRMAELKNATLASAVVESSSEESELEDPQPTRRFRPVYLDHKQWNAQDPRAVRIRRKAEQYKEALVARHGHPLERYRLAGLDQEM